MTPEEKVQKLIALKRYETPPEGYFDNFLTEFQERRADESNKPGLWKRTSERVTNFFRDLGGSRWIIGGGLAYAAVTVVFLIWQGRPAVAPSTPKTAPASYEAKPVQPSRAVKPVKPVPGVDLKKEKRYPKLKRRETPRREL